MTITKIIGVDFLKEYAKFISSNIDNDLIELSIIEAQEIDLQNILGSNLYEAIITKIDDNSLSSDTTYLSLVDDYCIKVLIYYAIKRSLSKILYKFNNKNIGEQLSTNTEPLDFQKYENLRKEFSNNAEYYAQRLINHLLEDGESLYEEFDTENDLDEISPNNLTRYNVGIDFSRAKSKKKYFRR